VASGIPDNAFVIRITGGDRYIDRNGDVRSLTDYQTIDDTRPSTPHAVENGARGVDFATGVADQVVREALNGTDFQPRDTYGSSRDGHWHVNLPNLPQFRNPSWPGDDALMGRGGDAWGYM